MDHSFVAKLELQMRMHVSTHEVLEEIGDCKLERLYAFVNVAEYIKEAEERVERVGDEVIVKCLTRAKFSQYFTLRQFPHDEHLLSIQLTSNLPTYISRDDPNVPPLKVTLVEDTRKPNVMRAHHVFMARDTWDLSPIVAVERWLSDGASSGSGRQYPHFYWSFELRRKPAFFHWNVSIPIFVLTTLSFAAFALEDLSDRVAVNLTLLLTSVAYKLVVAASLPQLSYLTVLDKYTLFSSLIICAVFAADSTLQSHGVAAMLLAALWCWGSLGYAVFCLRDTGQFVE